MVFCQPKEITKMVGINLNHGLLRKCYDYKHQPSIIPFQHEFLKLVLSILQGEFKVSEKDFTLKELTKAVDEGRVSPSFQ